MKTAPLPALSMVVPVPELALLAHEGTPRYGSYGQPADAQSAAAEHRRVIALFDSRYAGGNVYTLRQEDFHH